MAFRYLGIDPGRYRWGLAVIEPDEPCHVRCAVESVLGVETASRLCEQHEVRRVLLGEGTGSRQARARLESLGVPIVSAPERGTTLRARSLYWQVHPPRGWRRWIPLGLLTPPEPLDGYAAELIAREYLLRNGEPGVP